MQRMDAGGTLASRPSPNATSSPGWANNDPSGSSPPTIFDPDWANGIEAELEAIVAAGTGAALSKTATNQVLTAIQALIAQGQGATGQVQFGYSSATACALTVKNGCRLIIAGVGYQVPSAGISFPNTGVQVNGVNGSSLADSTVYYAAVYNNGGTLTPAFFSQASYGHEPDTTTGNIGTEVITSGGAPQSGYSLVGMIETNASGQFVAPGNGNLLVRSWFNKPGLKSATQFSTARSTSSTSLTEINSEIRCNFLVWAGETVPFSINAPVYPSGTPYGGGTGIAFDSTSTAEAEQISGNNYETGAIIPLTLAGRKTGLSEGSHYATLLGAASSGCTLTWNGSGVPPTTLDISVGV